MLKRENKINPLLYILYDKVERFKGSILLVEDICGKGLFDLDSNREILSTIHKSISTYGDDIIATTDIGLRIYRYNKGILTEKNPV